MKHLRLAIACAALTTAAAADSRDPMSADTPAAGPSPAEIPDFIMPAASDLRLGYVATIGRYRRSQESLSGVDSGFVEHGVRLSYVRALSPPGRAITGRAEWRAELGLQLSRAEVDNPNGSAGELQSAIIDAGFGPAWTVASTASSQIQVELMAVVGVGRSRYANTYASQDGGVDGTTDIQASGMCVEYALAAHLLWCRDDGWGTAMHAGLFQRAQELQGDRSTDWETGYVNRGDYTSDDTLTGVRLGVFVAKRF